MAWHTQRRHQFSLAAHACEQLPTWSSRTQAHESISSTVSHPRSRSSSSRNFFLFLPRERYLERVLAKLLSGLEAKLLQMLPHILRTSCPTRTERWGPFTRLIDVGISVMRLTSISCCGYTDSPGPNDAEDQEWMIQERMANEAILISHRRCAPVVACLLQGSRRE